MTEKNKTSRRATQWVGALFLLAMVLYGTGNALATTSVKNPIPVGCLLMLLNSLAVTAIGVLLFPLLQHRRPYVAYVYLCGRVLEAALLAVGAVLLFAQTADDTTLPVAVLQRGNFFAYQSAMLALGLGSVLFFNALRVERALPNWLSVWGVVGYAGLATGAVCDVFGLGIGLLLAVPGGGFELVFGVWLLRSPGLALRD